MSRLRELLDAYDRAEQAFNEAAPSERWTGYDSPYDRLEGARDRLRDSLLEVLGGTLASIARGDDRERDR